MPNDENRIKRGCTVISWCSLCKLQCCINLSSMHTVLSCCESFSSSQLQDVTLASIANTIWAIWFARNNSRFQDTSIIFLAATQLISAATTLSGNISKGSMKSSIDEFTVLKNLGTSILKYLGSNR
ncbi:hypothetical protein AAZX31_08G341300 [Glycine max]